MKPSSAVREGNIDNAVTWFCHFNHCLDVLYWNQAVPMRLSSREGEDW
ncbi:hypothetical protein L4C34_16965 [Vibrio profundum]